MFICPTLLHVDQNSNKKIISYPFLKHLQSQFSRLWIILGHIHPCHIHIFEFEIHFFSKDFQQRVISSQYAERFVFCAILVQLRLINKTVCGVFINVVYENPRGTLKLCHQSELIDWVSVWQAYMNNWDNEIAFMEVFINVFDTRKYRFGKQPQIVPIEPVNKFQCALVWRCRLVVVDPVDKLSRVGNDYSAQRFS